MTSASARTPATLTMRRPMVIHQRDGLAKAVRNLGIMFMAGLGVVPIRDSGSCSACDLANSVPVGALVAAAVRLPAAFVNQAPSARERSGGGVSFRGKNHPALITRIKRGKFRSRLDRRVFDAQARPQTKRGQRKFPRPRRAVDAFEPSGAVQRVQAAAGPQRPRAQNGLDALLEPLIVEAGNLREAERSAIAVAAVLERPDQLVAALYDAAAGPGRRQVDEDRVTPVRRPGAQEVGCRP